MSPPEVIVVTGTSSGLGKLTAEAFARHGSRAPPAMAWTSSVSVGGGDSGGYARLATREALGFIQQFVGALE